MARSLRVEARIFLLQLLCLLLVLQGEPLFALDRMAAAVAARPEAQAEEAPSPVPPPAAEAAPAEPAPAPALAEIAKPSGTEPPAGEGGSLWSGLLATLRFAAVAEPGLPPSPPTKSSFALPVGGPPTPFPQGSALDAVPVYTGWNLISLPEEPADPAPAAVFASIAGQLSEAFTYDHCDGGDPWKRYAPGDPAGSDLTAIDVKRGIWVDATAPLLLPSNGTLPATTTIPLCPGWNLIGFPAGQARHPLTVLAPIAGKYLRLYAYDASQAQPWAVFDPNVPVWANDLQLMEAGRGYWLLATEATALEIPNEDPAGPDVALVVPADLAVVTKPTDVLGRVSGKLLESWTLSYRASGEADWKEIVTQRYPIDGKLGTFDPTLLLNGLYDLRLEAVDANGLALWDEITVSVEGNMKIGNFTVSFVDLQIDMAGIPIQVIRTYDSRQKDRKGDFGFGWTLDIRQGTYRTNGPVGLNWEIAEGYEYAEGYPILVPCHDSVELRGHTASVRLSDQEYFRFQPILYDMGPTLGGCHGKVGFTAVSGFTPGAKLEVVGGNEVFFANGSDQLVSFDTLELFDPGTVRLETREGRIFEVDKADGIRLIRDSNDNQLTITEGAITHSAGLSVALVRDAQDRITKITDLLGNDLVYDYDGASDLVTFKDREGAQTRFVYTSHYLDSIVDPLGRTAIRNEYGPDGRLTTNIDALGNEIKYEHRLAQNEELVTNRLGKSRLLTYDDRGNVTKEVDELGKVTLRTFDGEDNLLTETDPLGHKTVNTYDRKNLITTKNPLGHVTSFTYDSRGDLLTITDPLSHVTTNTYDTEGKGNLEKTTDHLGHVIAFSYYPDGNLKTETNTLGQVTKYFYDDYGHPQSMIDAMGRVTTYNFNLLGNQTREQTTRTKLDGGNQPVVTGIVYNRQQRQIATVAPDGGVTRTEYDASGQVKAIVDPLGWRTTFQFDDLGRQIRTVYQNGTSEEKTYDAENRVLEWKDRQGRTTLYSYDDKGRLLSVTYPDGAVTRSVYDDADRLITSIDARGKSTTFVYDNAGRRTRVIDALNHVTEIGYDDAGRRQTFKDPKGYVTTFVHDELNRHVRTILPDTYEMVTGYDELGRRKSQKDQAGKETFFGYDELGRLETVTDAMGYVTTYTHDEIGSLTSHEDANGHITRFEYDAVGRQIARILPDGAMEKFTYDLAGNRTSRTDFRGFTTLYEYDNLNRLERRRYPDGSQVSFTYTSSGQRKTAVDGRGTTRYEYDSRDRLSVLVYPDGRKLAFAYDRKGNRTSLTATVGTFTLTTSYTYDDLDRLSTVTDPQGGVAAYHYDANSNRDSLQQSNGVVTDYDYDPLDRLDSIAAVNAAGAPVTSFEYTLGPSGNPEEIAELGGVLKSYVYDDLYRLKNEKVVLGSMPRWSNDFGYDPVGNRLTQNRVEVGGNPRNVAYSYDQRDRLTTENILTYVWNPEGNLVSKSGPEGANYEWDFENRLKRVVLANGTQVDHSYDVDGTRVKTTTTSAAGPAQTVDYLVDTSGGLSQVVLEGSSASNVTAYYVRGDDLLSVIRPVAGAPSLVRHYHADALGSIRALTDAAGAITDTWQFEAFGTLVAHSGSDPNAYLFAGEMLDPKTGWAYHRARWMDTALGRFPSMDPYPSEDSDPRTLQRYNYARARPTDRRDPTGLSDLISLQVTNAIKSIIRGSTSILNTAFKVYRTADAIRDTYDWARLAMKAWQYLAMYPTPEGAMIALMQDAAAVAGLGPDLAPLDSGIKAAQRFLGNNWEDMRNRIVASEGVIAAETAAVIVKHSAGIAKARVKGYGNAILYLPSAPGSSRNDLFIGMRGKFEAAIQITGGGRLFGLGYRYGKTSGNTLQFFRIDYAERFVYDPHWHLESKPGQPL